MNGRQWLAVLVSATLGAGAALGAGACGEDRGSVDIEGGGTGTNKTRTGKTSTGKTSTGETSTATTPQRTSTTRKP